MPWEWGSAAQGSCPESLRVLSNSRGKTSAQGSVTHLGHWTAGSRQNTFSGVKFSKPPSAEAFHQLLQTACAAPGPLKAPQGGLRRERGQDKASPRRIHPPCRGHPPCPARWSLPQWVAGPEEEEEECSPLQHMGTARLLPVVPLACSLFLWLQWLV